MGLLVDGRPMGIKGICWGPTPKGQANNPDFSGNVEKDAKLMQEAGINVVRTYGTLADRSVLDALWAKGIWVVPTVYAWGGSDPSVVIDAVNAVKDHPAILMWSIGNEWNYNGIYVHLSKWESVHKLNQAAQLIKENDNEHPVASIYGEVPGVDVIHAMPNVDVWGINSYRGISHGGLFNDYVLRTNKPMFMGEYGADAFNARVNAEDQGAQAYATKELTREIVERSSATGGDVLGGFLFEFNDEWWKDGAGSNWAQDVGGIAPGGGPYPDKTFNEEWWGIVDIDRNPRAAYWEYRAIQNPAEPTHVDCCGSCEGSAYCSPQSGSCYDTKVKDYYDKCFVHDDCCSSCGGLGFCSPLSGTCYQSQAKDYYLTCAAVVDDASDGDDASDVGDVSDGDDASDGGDASDGDDASDEGCC